MSISQLSLSSLTDFIDEHHIVVVDFWAEWCAPCVSFFKTFDKVSHEYEDIAFAQLDMESNADAAEALNIQSIPHLMIFKEGIAIYSESGSMPESTLRELIEQAISVDVSDIKKDLDDNL